MHILTCSKSNTFTKQIKTQIERDSDNINNLPYCTHWTPVPKGTQCGRLKVCTFHMPSFVKRSQFTYGSNEESIVYSNTEETL